MVEKKPWYRKSVAELLGKETPPAKSFAEFQAEATAAHPPRATEKADLSTRGEAPGWWDDPTVARAVTREGMWSRMESGGAWHHSRRLQTSGPYTRDQVAQQALPDAEVHMRFGPVGQRIYTGPYRGGGGGM